MAGQTQVWYVSYGSNLLQQRFHCYIAGGKPVGSSRWELGCRDRTLPSVDRLASFPFRLLFAGAGRTQWGDGGLAYIQPATDTRYHLLTRMYLITAEQFIDVVNQENDITPPFRLDIDLNQVQQLGKANLPFPCLYGEIIHLGETDGHPMLTFTCTQRDVIHAPAVAYLKTIIAGLRELKLSDQQILDYLQLAEGIDKLALREHLHHSDDQHKF